MKKLLRDVLLCGVSLLLSLGLALPQTVAAGDEFRIIRVDIHGPEDVAVLSNFGAIWEVQPNHLIADVTDAELAAIRDQGYTVHILYRTSAEYLGAQRQLLAAQSDAGAFHTYAEVDRELHQLAAKHPKIARVHNLGSSHEGRTIWALKISDGVKTDQALEPDILFVGGLHAREWIGVEVPMLLAKFLVENYDSDESVKALVNKAEIWIVPMANPDGHQYTVAVDRLWRKNRRVDPGGCYGVDLNRNFSFKWGGPGTSDQACSDIYRGPEAASEPEVQAIMKLGMATRFSAGVSFHSYGQIIYYPWSGSRDPAVDQPSLNELAGQMSQAIFNVRGQGYSFSQAPPAAGSSVDWDYGLFGVPDFGIELGTGTFLTPESEILPIWEDLKPACLLLIEWAERFPLKLKANNPILLPGKELHYTATMLNTTDEKFPVRLQREVQDAQGELKDRQTWKLFLKEDERTVKNYKYQVKADMPPGVYTQRLGLYDQVTGLLLSRESFDFTVVGEDE